MPLVGSLRDLSLSELLAVIASGERSGTVTIRSDAGTAQIHISRGRIVQASDTLRDERFGEILLKLGKISPETLASALEAQEMSGGARRLGVILVEMGSITKADQDAAILYQTSEALYDLCTWQVGFFQFDSQDAPEPTGIAIPVDTLLEEVDRRAQAGERTRRDSMPHAVDSPFRNRRELTPDKMELLRLNRSFHLKTDEFAPESEPVVPAGEPAIGSREEEQPVLDVADLELGGGEGESL